MATVEIWTYESKNAPEDQRWVAYPIINGSQNVRCSAATESDAIAKAQSVIDMDLAKYKVTVTAPAEKKPRAQVEKPVAEVVAGEGEGVAKKYDGSVYWHKGSNGYVGMIKTKQGSKYTGKADTIDAATIKFNAKGDEFKAAGLI